MSSARATSDASFEQDLPEQGIAIVDFWAQWCGPCRGFAPVFERSAAENLDVTHLKVDVDANSALSARFAIQAVPTLVLFKHGVLLGALPGAISAARLAELIEQLRAIEPDELSE